METSMRAVIPLIGLILVAISPVLALITTISIEEIVIYEKYVELKPNNPVPILLLFSEHNILSLQELILMIENRSGRSVTIYLHGCNETMEKISVDPSGVSELWVNIRSCYIYSEEQAFLKVIIKGVSVKYPYKPLLILTLALPVAGSTLLINYIVHRSVHRQDRSDD